MDQRNVIKLVKSYLENLQAHHFDIKAAYIFGSYAKGKANQHSDIDLAIILSELPNPFEMEVRSMTLRQANEILIEPHLFEQQDFTPSNPFAREIIQTGIKLALN